MAAPTHVGSAYTASFSSVASVALTITNGFTAGNTVIVGVTQTQSLQRTVSLSDGTNTYAEATKATLSSAHTHLHYKVNMSALSGGGAITLTLSGSSVGVITAREISESTYSTLADTYVRASLDTAQYCAATGLTTNGDVYVFGVGATVSSHGGVTPTDGYATVVAPELASTTLYKASDTSLTATQGPWTTVNSRYASGCLAAFYAPAAPASGGAMVFNLQIG